MGLDPVYASVHQAPGVQKMLGAKAALGPAGAIIEFDPEEIADFTEHTVFYYSAELAIRIGDVEGAAQRDRPIYLQTGPGQGNIFQIGHTAAGPSVRILPLDIDQIRAQHSELNSAIHHTSTVVIGQVLAVD